MWRPDDWDEFKKAEVKRWFDKTGSGSFSFPHFEAGADAMLEALCKVGGEWFRIVKDKDGDIVIYVDG